MSSEDGMRILITTDAVGGVWVFSSLLARELAARGADVTLVTLGPAPRVEQCASLKGARNVELIVTDFALEWMDPQGGDVERARRGLARVARQRCPHLVHVNGYREALVNWRVPILLTAHSCVRSWWLACRGEEPPKRPWEAYIANVGAGLAEADLWVAPSAAFRNCMQALYSPGREGHAIHNGISFETVGGDKEPFIAAAGRLWDEAKNVGALAAAAADLPWPIRVAGAASESQSTAPNLLLLGELPRRDLLCLLARAGTFVAPALYEPFGLCALEAAMSGCALVLSDISTFRELWGGAALFIDPQDRGALASALRRLCEDELLRTRLQRVAAQRARRYSAPAMVDAYCKCYQTILSPLAYRSTSPLVLRERQG